MNVLYKLTIILLCTAVVSACKHPLSITGEGDIVERLTGQRGCSLEESITNDDKCAENSVVGEDYIVSYEAVPRPGWRFVGWEGTACGNSSLDPLCEYNLPQVWVDFFEDSFPGFAFAPTVAVFEEVDGNSELVSEPNADATVVPLLYIIVSFTDQDQQFPAADHFDKLYTDPLALRAHTIENTYGLYDIVPVEETHGTSNDGIVELSLATTHPDTTGSSPEFDTIARSAIAAASDFVNFAAYDVDNSGVIEPEEMIIAVVYSGGESIFAQAPDWKVMRPFATGFDPDVVVDGKSLRQIIQTSEARRYFGGTHLDTVASTMAHEIGHYLWGLPDLYDIDDSSNGIGEWGLMAFITNTQFTGDSQLRAQHFTGYSKSEAFSSVTDISSSVNGLVVGDLESNPDIYRIWLDPYKVRESIMLENRQQKGFDLSLPDSGLLVTHIDRSRPENNDENHRRVNVIQADGDDDLTGTNNFGDTGDLFPFGGVNELTDFTDPDLRTYDGETTGVSLTNIQESNGLVSLDVDVPIPSGEFSHLRNDPDNLSNLFRDANTQWGFQSPVVFTGSTFQNGPLDAAIDGVEIFLGGDSVINVEIYQSIIGSSPSNLLFRQTGFQGESGWNRFMFDNPPQFDANESVFVVFRINTASTNFPAFALFDAYGDLEPFTSYLSDNGSFYQTLETRYRQILLLSHN